MKKLMILIFLLGGMFPAVSWSQATSEGSDGEVVAGHVGAAGLTAGSGGGNTGGSASIQIDEFMGAATHSVSIPVPPGRAGIEPQLTLNYHSHRKNPNSWVGYGWDLDIGSIERTAENGFLDLHEGTKFEARLGGQSEELFLVETGASASSYGVILPSNMRLDRYQARVDSAFNIYLFLKSTHANVQDGGWVVIDKSGKRYEFGVDFARIGGPGREAFKWLLTRVVDTNGNDMVVDYDSEHVIDRIRYSGITIDFTSIGERSYYPQYRQSFLRERDIKLLTSIAIYDGATRLQRFALVYDTSSRNGIPLLNRVHQYGKSDSVTLPPTIFSYYDDLSIKFADQAVSYRTGGVQGDETNSGLPNNQTQYMDMNGDGLVDQVVGFKETGDFKVLYNRGGNFVDLGAKSDWKDPFDCENFSEYPCKGRVIYYGDSGKDQLLFLMDINGDALPDRIRGRNLDSHEAYFEVALNTGAKWDTPKNWPDPVVGKDSGRSTHRVGFLDMNGDGLLDRIEGRPSEKRFNVYQNTGTSFQTTPRFWDDPFGHLGSDFSAAGYLYDYNPSNGAIYMMTRDMNGDGLPDRVAKGALNEADHLGFDVYLNSGGIKWATPVLNEEGRALINTVDHLFMDDFATYNPNHPDKEYNAVITRRHDLMDFNGDGYLDRVVSIKPENSPTGRGRFEVYIYKGLNSGETSQYFNRTPIILEDPVGSVTSDPWGGEGYLTKTDNDSDGDNERHTYMQDMNGDGYLDRVTSTKINGREMAQVHYLEANPIAVDDTADKTRHRFNQPLYALKKISTGVGMESVVEYAPSTEKFFAESPSPTDHRFLPLPMYVVHKAYATDYTMTAEQKSQAENYPEGQRNSGMRWVTYGYKGGHLFIKPAVPAQGTAPAIPPVQRFVGFHETIKAPIHFTADVWQPYRSITRYFQPLGSIDNPLATSGQLNAFLDPEGYGHFALTGKPYFQKVVVNERDLVIEKSDWNLSNASSDLFGCVGSCFPFVATQSKFVYEPAGGVRGSLKKFTYNETNGNLLKTDEYQSMPEGEPELLLTTEIAYDERPELKALHIQDRILAQRQLKGEDVFRDKVFSYDTKGNPKSETFVSREAGVPSQIMTRTFNALGNLTEMTEIDGVRKQFVYDTENLFPLEEKVIGGSVNLTTKRIFNRLLGKPSKETGPSGAGTRVVHDDFGRPIEEYVISTTGSETLMKKYRYTDQYPAVFDGLWPVNLSKVEVFDIKPDYAVQSLNVPAEVSYMDGAGSVLQKCSLSERSDYRVIQNRVLNGGQLEVVTEPVFKDSCPFFGTLLNSKVARTTKDFMGRTLSVDYPEGDGTDSPVLDATSTYRALANGHLVTVTTQGSQSQEQEFDITERVRRVKDTQGNQIFYDYNGVGDLTAVRDDAGVMTSIQYDTLGRKKEMTDKNLGTWKYFYDQKGRLIRQIDAKQNKVEYVYDALGRITTKKGITAAGDTDHQDLYTYDNGSSGYDVKLGELAKVEERDAASVNVRTTLFGYDPLFRRAQKVTRYIKDVGSFTQTMQTDVKGRVLSTVYPGGKTVHYKYNLVGSLEKTCDTQDCSGEIYHSVDPATGYDVYGAIQKETYGNGVTSDYVYYPNSHRLKERSVSLGSTIHSKRAYTFDGFTNMTSLTDPLDRTGSSSWQIVSYDNLNRLTSYQAKIGGKTESFEYDSSGNILKNTASYGDKRYHYDPARPHAVTRIGEGPDAESFSYDSNGNMLTDKVRTMQYSAQNQLTKVTMSNNVVVEYDYDYTGARVLKKVTKKDPLNKIIVTNTHFLGEALEVRGENVHLHVNVGSQRVATHGLGTLSGLQGIAAGSMHNANFEPDMTMAMLAPWLMLAVVLFGLVSIRPIRWKSSPIAVMPAFFCRNPVSLKLVYFIHCTFRLWSNYTHSLHESLHQLHLNRFAKFVSLVLAFISVTLFPMSQVALAGDTGSVVSPADDEYYFVYYHGDHLGSTHIITEGKASAVHSGLTYSEGSLLQRIEYAPFGKELFVLNANLKFDPRYTGQEYDIETGLYYYKARYYNPTLGRFIQADTVVPDARNYQAYNRYAYAANNPLKYTDPSGHSFWGWFKKLFAAFIGALIGVLVTIASAGALAGVGFALTKVTLSLTLGQWMLAGAIGGLVGGAITGAINGGIKGALLGALMGAVGGALFSGANSAIGSALTAVQKLAVFGGVGLGLSAATGGWKGMLTFAAGFAGGLVGVGVTGGFKGQGTSEKAIGGPETDQEKIPFLEELVKASKHMEFNGNKVSYYDENGKLIGSYSASSGRNGVTDSSIKNMGPTPEGLYSVSPDNVVLNGPATRMSGDWGTFRVKLQPFVGTETFGRGEFFMHNGVLPGSAGCIDVGGSTGIFFRLMGESSAIPLIVRY